MLKRRLRNRASWLMLLTVLLGLVLAACGDDTATTAPVATTAAATTAAATTAAATTAPATTTAAAPTAAATTAAATTAAATTAAATTTAAGASTLTNFSSVKAADTMKVGPGIDKATKTIKIGALTPLSGPIAALGGKSLTQGVQSYFEAVNANGGIGGYKIQVVLGDTAYQPQKAVQEYSKMAQDVAIIPQVYGSPIAAAIKEQSEADKMLFGVAGFGSFIITNYKYAYLVGVPYPVETINGLDYAANKLGKKAAKFGFIYQDDEYGQDSLKGYKEGIKGLGLTDVGQVPYKIGDKDVSGQVTQLKTAGAEVVFMATQPTETGLIMGTAAQLGYNPQWIMQSPAYNFALLGTADKPSAIKPIVEKALWCSFGVTWGDPAAPGEAVKLAAAAKYAPDVKPGDGAFTLGWVQSIVTANILAKAMANGDMTRDGLIAAFEQQKNIEFGGTAPTVSYGPTANDRVPSRETTMFKIDATALGTAVPIAKVSSEVGKTYKLS